MPLTRDKGAITRYGGGVIKLREVQDDGSNPGLTVEDLGYVQETTLTDVTDIEIVTDETGAQVQSFDGNRRVSFTGILMQTNKDLIDFLKDTARGKYYQVYYKANSNVNGKVQEIFFGICRIKPQIELSSTNRRIPLEINVLKNETQITVADANSVYGSTTPSATIPAGAYYVITETTIPLI